MMMTEKEKHIYARNVGMRHPDIEWVVTPDGEWLPNPFCGTTSLDTIMVFGELFSMGEVLDAVDRDIVRNQNVWTCLAFNTLAQES